MLSSPYYKWLRTDKKLGYIVSASAFPQKTVPGLIFIVQSPTASPAEIVAESTAFFADFESQLAVMDQQSFEQHKQGLISKLTVRKKNMAEKASYFWQEIDAERLSFDTNQAIADKVATITLAEMLALFKTSIFENSDPRLLFTVNGEHTEKEPSKGNNTNQWLDLSAMKDIQTFK